MMHCTVLSLRPQWRAAEDHGDHTASGPAVPDRAKSVFIQISLAVSFMLLSSNLRPWSGESPRAEHAGTDHRLGSDGYRVGRTQATLQ
jgi:hypothetical protein